MEQLPHWLTGYMDAPGAASIAAAVEAAERRTSGEIVPMIVRRSTHTGHVAWVLFFALSSLFIGFAPIAPGFGADVSLWVLEGAGLVCAASLAWPLARLGFFQKLCTPEADRDAAAMMRAELEFFESGVTKTESRTGVLIFVSLLERRAVVLADEAIASRLPKDAWDEVVDAVIAGVKRKDFAGGMEGAIARAARLIEPLFPPVPGDKNEIPNRLRIEE